jgi:branched-chain amino acid transport system permease protein
MVLTLMYFPNGIVGTLARKNKLPRWLNWGRV